MAMRKKAFVAFVTVVMTSAVVCGIFLFASENKAAQKEFEATLSRIASVGARKNAVLNRLKTAHIEHSPYLTDTHQILAIARETSKGFLVSSDTQAVIEFGKNGKVSRLHFREIHTGL